VPGGEGRIRAATVPLLYFGCLPARYTPGVASGNGLAVHPRVQDEHTISLDR